MKQSTLFSLFLTLMSFCLPVSAAAEQRAGTLRSWGGYLIPHFPSDLRLTAISASPAHTLGLARSGKVVAWGSNSHGQCNVPPTLFNVTAIAAGHVHSIALRADGTVTGWGAAPASQVPPDLTNIIALAAGDSFSLALKGDGTVVGWGQGNFGTLDIPAGLNDAVQIDASGFQCIALRRNGTVVTWGNYGGVLPPPPDLANVIQVSASPSAHFALRADGTVVVWGRAGSFVQGGLPGLKRISAGINYNLGVKQDDSVIAWSRGHVPWWEEAGQGLVPENLSGVIAIEAERFHSIALTSDGKITTWGSNFVPGPGEVHGFVSVESGAHTLAVNSTGEVKAWGSNKLLQSIVPPGLSNVVKVDVGGHPTIEHDQSQSVVLDSAGRATGWARSYWGGADPYGPPCPGSPFNFPPLKDIAAGAFWAAGLTTAGEIKLWGCQSFFLTVPSDLGEVIAIEAGRMHGLALLPNGTVRTFGQGNSETMGVPPGLSNVVAVAAGWDYSLALRSDGTIINWGRSLGNINFPPINLTNVVAIRAGLVTASALKADGSLTIWRDNGDSLDHTIPSDLGEIIAISSGYTVIVATPPPDGPILNFQKQNTTPSLNWNRTGTLYKLQRKNDLAENTPWEDANQTPNSDAQGYSVPLDLDHGSCFYRLVEI